MKKNPLKKTCLISAFTASILSPVYAFEIDITRANSTTHGGGIIIF